MRRSRLRNIDVLGIATACLLVGLTIGMILGTPLERSCGPMPLDITRPKPLPSYLPPATELHPWRYAHGR